MSEYFATVFIPFGLPNFYGRSAVLGSLMMVVSSCGQASVTLSTVASFKLNMASINSACCKVGAGIVNHFLEKNIVFFLARASQPRI
jgi:hypothetical protein